MQTAAMHTEARSNSSHEDDTRSLGSLRDEARGAGGHDDHAPSGEARGDASPAGEARGDTSPTGEALSATSPTGEALSAGETGPTATAATLDQTRHAAPRVLILACGALAREIRDIARLHDLGNVDLECLPAVLHNRPELIPDAVRERLDRHAGGYDRVLLGYADCGTGGELAALCTERGVEMLPGDHCYEFFAGGDAWQQMHHSDPTIFYLTDYLAKHFERIILDGLGITAHPELCHAYFGNYTKLVYLAQTDDDDISASAEAAAERLGLDYERIAGAYGDLEPAVVQIAQSAQAASRGQTAPLQEAP